MLFELTLRLVLPKVRTHRVITTYEYTGTRHTEKISYRDAPYHGAGPVQPVRDVHVYRGVIIYVRTVCSCTVCLYIYNIIISHTSRQDMTED